MLLTSANRRSRSTVTGAGSSRATAHELVTREHLAQLRDALRASGLFVRRDAVARGCHTRPRQQRRRELAGRVDLEIAEHARDGAHDGKRRQRRALHEIRGGIAFDDEERVVAERARVLRGNRGAQRRVDARGQFLGGHLRVAKRLPLELAIRLRDQHARGNGERQKESRENELQHSLVESFATRRAFMR